MKATKRAIVCGSTDGIGKAVALNLCREGYAVTLVARNEEKLSKTLEELRHISSENHSSIQLNFEKPETIHHILSKNDGWQEDKLALINNVGGPPPINILDCGLEDWQKVFNKQFLSFSEMTKYFVPKMVEKKWGRIVTVLGTSVVEPIPGLGLSVVKGATANWSQALSSEVGQWGITVNTVLPGPTDTQELDDIVAVLSQQYNKTKEDIIGDALQKIPVGRLARPAEIADGIAFLCSDKAAFITGTNLKIDGGFTNSL